ncbi:MAG: hypothetical protein WCW44_00545 [archaeon]|jgi:hypothetical protein
MGFGDIARDIKRNPLPVKTAPKVEQNDITDAIIDGEKSSTASVQKQDISYRDSEIKGFVPQARFFGSRLNNDPKHGSIIRNIASESNSSSQMGATATWEDCKHHKNQSGRDFCAEFHSLCAKERCRRARR